MQLYDTLCYGFLLPPASVHHRYNPFILMGLPDLPFHLRLDPLAGFFLTVIGLLGFFVSIYSLGYVRGFIGQRPIAKLVIFYSLFLAGSQFVQSTAKSPLWLTVGYTVISEMGLI